MNAEKESDILFSEAGLTSVYLQLNFIIDWLNDNLL